MLRGPSALQGQARVQAAVAQTLEPHLGVKVQRSHVLWRKGYVFRSKLLVIVLLLLGNRERGSDIIIMKAFPTSSSFSSNVALHQGLSTVLLICVELFSPTSDSSDPAGGSAQPYILLPPSGGRTEKNHQHIHLKK